ncbi:unnamed protein product, partial [Symbiodinium sp. KB8]
MMSVIADGGTFADASIPSAIRHTAKDMHHFTWFVTPHTSGDNLCRTAAGSRPGESWADTVYSFIYGRVLNKIGELARGEEITPTHCRDSTFGIYATAEEGEPIYGQDATWADDSAWPIVAPTPLDLLNKASRLCSLVLSQYMSHGMKPNLGRNKTALMFVLRGKGAVQAVKSAFKNGQASLHLSDLDIDVPTTSQYKHLGGIIDHKTQMAAEARQRLAIATQAFDKGQTLLYLNSTIPLKVRAALLQTTVTATFHNLALWIPEGPSWQLLSNGYARLVKKLLSKQFPGDVYFKLPAAAAYIITGCIPLEILARKARLSLLVSMCKAGPAALSASLQTEQSWFTVLRQDLQWLVGEDHGKSEAELRKPPKTSAEEQLLDYFYGPCTNGLVSNFTYKRKQQAARELSTALWYREATAQLADGNTGTRIDLQNTCEYRPPALVAGAGGRKRSTISILPFHSNKIKGLRYCSAMTCLRQLEIAALLKTTVTRFPLYEDEAKHLLDFVHQEAREVHNELIDHGWTSNTEQEVTAAVESLLS